MDECRHEFVSGALHVNEEDLDMVAHMRAAAGEPLPACLKCEAEYVPADLVYVAVDLDAVAVSLAAFLLSNGDDDTIVLYL